MTPWLHHPAMIGVLLVTVCGVWGAAAVRVIAALGEPALVATDAAGASAPLRAPEAPAPLAPYAGDYRDPFAEASAPPAVAAAPVPAPPPRRPPALRVTGVIGTMAVVEAPSGAAHLVEVGTLIGLRQVLEVRPRWVVLDGPDGRDTLRLGAPFP